MIFDTARRKTHAAMAPAVWMAAGWRPAKPASMECILETGPRTTDRWGSLQRADRRLSGRVFVLLTLGATFLMGSSFVAGKILLAHGVPATLLMGWRFFVAAFCTLPFAIDERGRNLSSLFPLTWSDTAKTILIGLLQTTGVMGTLLLALKFVPTSTAALLQFTNPLWMAAISPLLLGRKLRSRGGLGLLLGICGVALAIASGIHIDASTALLGDGLALLSAICWVLATLLRTHHAPRLGSWTLAFWQMLIGSLAILMLGYAIGEHWPMELGATGWLWFAWLSIPASSGATGLCFIVLDTKEPWRCSSFLFLAPLFTILLSFVLTGEAITVAQIGADLMVGGALWLLNSGTATGSRLPERQAYIRPQETQNGDD